MITKLLSRSKVSIPFQLIRHKATVKVPYEPIHEVGSAAAAQHGKGKIYDKKPFKFTLVKGKSYLWCACGWSHSQPFCDNTHKNPHFKITMRPVRIIAQETREYWLCNCKQTSQRPFCDGTHRIKEIQDAIKS